MNMKGVWSGGLNVPAAAKMTDFCADSVLLRRNGYFCALPTDVELFHWENRFPQSFPPRWPCYLLRLRPSQFTNGTCPGRGRCLPVATPYRVYIQWEILDPISFARVPIVSTGCIIF